MKKLTVSVAIFATFLAIIAQGALQKVPGRMITMPGMVVAYAGATAPDWCVFPYGQSVLRAGTYAGLFAVIGTTYGSADGTHFNLPDMRGRTVFGDDDMGGSAASRITNAVSGIAGATLSSVGGSQLMHQHTHVQTSHNHTQDPHGHTQVSHDHGGATGNPANGGGDLFYLVSNSNPAHYGGAINLYSPNTQGDGLIQHTHSISSATPAINNSTATNQATTAVNQDAGTGAAQNMPPTIIMNWCITL